MWRTCTICTTQRMWRKLSQTLKLIGTIWKIEGEVAGGGHPVTRTEPLEECMEEYGRGSAESKCCGANLVRLCVVENLPLHIGTRPGLVKFMSKWEPRWPSISKQNVTRSVECQSRELREEIKREMEEVAKETDIAFTTAFWTSPTGESFMTISMHWRTQN